MPGFEFHECLRIGAVPDLAGLRTAQWAHMLGFRGHFSTKSRAYSTTLGALRAARTEHASQLPTGDTVLVIANWHFTGLGHLDDPDDPPPPAESATPPTRREKGDQP